MPSLGNSLWEIGMWQQVMFDMWDEAEGFIIWKSTEFNNGNFYFDLYWF
jgi:hypothetical protein